MSKCPTCPFADGECRSYSTLCENHAANPKKWRPVLDRLNAPLEPSPHSTPIGYALESAVGFVKSRGAASGDDEAERRHAICRSCPHGLYDAARDACRRCSCTMRRKVRGLGFKCPLGEW
jgi:hypothetical protein